MELVYLFLFILASLTVLPFILGGAPFLPSLSKENAAELRKVAYFLKKSNKNSLIDIGSGDGRAVLFFNQQGFKACGIEINPFLVFLSKIRLRKKGFKSSGICWGSFWKKTLSPYDVVYFFHYPKANKKIIEKLSKELKQEALIVSAAFPLENIRPVFSTNNFWVYKMPTRV